MSIRVNWLNPEKTAIHLAFQRGWKWNDVYAAISQADTLIGSVPQRVDLIIDVRNAGSIPTDFITVAGDVFSKGEARANEGRRIVVGAGWLMRAAYSTFLGVYSHKLQSRPFQFASSMQEAQSMLSAD